MGEITLQSFTRHPACRLNGRTAQIRVYYTENFVSEGIDVQASPAGSSTFYNSIPCTIELADGLLTADESTLVTTTNGNKPNARAVGLLFQGNRNLNTVIFNWRVTNAFGSLVTYDMLQAWNDAGPVAVPEPTWPTTDTVAAMIQAAIMLFPPASQTQIGSVFTSVDPSTPGFPVAWITDDPLVRNAIALYGIDLQDFTITLPNDGQVLTYNQANNQWEAQNSAAGTGNVISNEVFSVDGELTLMSGTGGKTIKKGVRLDNPSELLGRGDSGGGDPETISLGSGLSMTGTVLSATGTGGDVTAAANLTDEAIVVGGGGVTGVQTTPVTVNPSTGLMVGATVDDPPDDLDIANKEFVLASLAAALHQTPNITALVQGGGVFWVQDYEFQVAAATYLIQGDLFTSAGDTVTLDPADPALDRIDVIALDDTGSVVVITGTAAAQPSQPDVDPGTQLQLTFVLVTANTTAPPSVSNTDIYIDNAEWTTSTSGSGWNANSTNNPYSGTKCIEGTSVANAAYVQLQAPAPLTLDTFAILSAFIASKAGWPKKRSLIFQWYTAGVAVGTAVTINTGFFGFDSSNTAYQLLAIPIAQFAVPAATSLNQLRITDQGGAIGMYIDNLVLQANGSSIGPPPTQGLTQAQADARYLQQTNSLSDVASASSARTNIGAQAGPLTGDVTTSGAAATLANTAVTPGSYTNTNLTVDSKGRITAAANGAAGPGSSIPSTVQGDTLYASAANTLSALAKDTNATRYLSNTGASNNPAWAQVALSTGISGFGTGVATALGTNVGSAGAPVVNGGALGTPSSGTLSSCAGLPVSTGISGLGSGIATFLDTPSSANLASAVTDETGSGAAVFGTGPTITSPLVSLTAAHGSDDTYTGTTIVGLNAGATIAQWEAVYLDSSSTWQLADANGSSTYPARGLAVAAYSNTNPATILVHGTVRNDAWNWTPGGTIYLSGTAA